MTQRTLWRVVLIAIVLVVAGGPSLSRSTAQSTDTTWSGLPQELRERVHLSVSELPPFPEDANLLRDLRNWPTTRTFDKERYALVLRELSHDTGRPVRSPEEIRPGSRYAASYHLEGRPRRGPAYSWSAEGTVLAQVYYGKDRTESRVYDRAGRLMKYHYSRPDPRPSWLSCSKRPRIGAEEHFDPSGRLVGFFTDGKNYWAGRERGSLEYSDSIHRWNSWMGGDSIRRPGRLPR
jgi:hypothetical protein